MTAIKRLFSLLLSCAILTFFSLSCVADDGADQKRDRLIGYLLYRDLPESHFGDKQLDDALSEAAFRLFLERIDSQKRFFLQEDINVMGMYRDRIDDNLKSGAMALPKLGYDILMSRLVDIEKIVDELCRGNFDLEKAETYETDPDKIGYAAELSGLRDRWRKILKVRITSRYFDLLDEAEKKAEENGKTAEKPATPEKNVLDKTLWAEAKEKVAKSNADLFTRLRQETLQDFYDLYFDAVARAFDPHTNYMAPDNKEDFDIHMRGSLEGIGAMLREDDGCIKVVSIVPGSASSRQGQLKAEDVILQVGEAAEEPVDITNMRLRDAVRLVRGPKGTEVRLTVKKPDGKQMVIPIIRDVVQIEETFVKHTMLEQDGAKIGYILIPSFYRDFEKSKDGSDARNVTDDTRAALEDLLAKGAEALVFDLRDNGGGSLVDAVDVTGLFIRSGPVVQVKNSIGLRRVLSDTDDAVVWDKPMVVLVDHFSASASEIVAAALQDYGRAVIVGGKHTHGKGTVQKIAELNDWLPTLQLQQYGDLGALKVTIQKFYRINGGSTQYKGVEPDIVLPSLYDYMKTGEQYLDYSLPWDQVAPVVYDAYEPGSLDLKTLQEKSRIRVADDEALQVIGDEAERARLRMEKTEMSLRFEDMLHERQVTDEARDKVGAQYTKYREQEDDNGDQAVNQSEEDKEKKWLKTVNEDPYIKEAEHVLADIGLVPVKN